MKTLIRVSVVAAIALLLALPALAAEEGKTVTLTGKVACAKCTLKKADAKACQDVLVVEGEQAGEYYLVKNAVLDKFGHNCKGEKAAVVTGSVMEKDGKTWLTPTKMEAKG